MSPASVAEGTAASASRTVPVLRTPYSSCGARLDLGINYIDTAHAYATEQIVGKAVRGRRDGVVISTKMSPRTRDGELLDAAGLRVAVQASLEKLGTDWIDVYHLHGVGDAEYATCVADLVPELERLRDQGTIRFLALSERFGADAGHTMLQRAVEDDCWDVMMVGFNPLNPSARDRVFSVTRDDRRGDRSDVRSAARAEPSG